MKLSPYNRDYDNSIRGPQKVDRQAYRLRVEGLVQRPQSLTYDQVIALPSVKEVVLMPCVEGWSETLLYQGPRLSRVLALAGVKKEGRMGDVSQRGRLLHRPAPQVPPGRQGAPGL